MDTEYNTANVPHALFTVIERTACLWKLFAEGNYYWKLSVTFASTKWKESLFQDLFQNYRKWFR